MYGAIGSSPGPSYREAISFLCFGTSMKIRRPRGCAQIAGIGSIRAISSGVPVKEDFSQSYLHGFWTFSLGTRPNDPKGSDIQAAWLSHDEINRP
jgi:hypothetical protein